MFTEIGIHFGKCSNNRGDTMGAFPTGSQPMGNKEIPMAYHSPRPYVRHF
jgi:hypothetical protein